MSERSAVGRVRSEGEVETESDGNSLGGDTSAEAAGVKKKELDGEFFRFWGDEVLEVLRDRLEALLAFTLEGIAGARARKESGGRPGA